MLDGTTNEKETAVALNKLVFTVVRAMTRLRPDITKSYAQQRIAEDVSGKFAIASPRCRIDDITVEAADGYEIPLRVFTPLNIDFSVKRGLHVDEDFRGTILFFHGGGWANGDIDFYTDCCTRMALRLERRVVAVDYRRSPEHPFPTSIEDCYEVARKLFAREILEDVQPERIVLFGDSAGGNIAAVVSLMARDRGEFSPNTQVLLYPLTYNDHSLNTIFESVIENGEDYLLTRADIEGYVSLYLPDPEDYSNPYFAPLIAESLEGMPRTLLISAEYCPLRDEGETYAARVQDEGGDVECFRMLNAVHGYFLYPTVLTLVRDTYSVISHFLDHAELPRKEGSAWIRLLGTS